MPPVNSTPRCKPRVRRKNTASTNVTAEITLNTSAWRMKGISLWMRKNSMCLSYISSSSVVLSFAMSGRACCAFLPAHVADRQPLQTLARAEHQIDDRARHRHGAEHGSHDAEHVHHREAAYRPGAEQEQRNAREHAGQVRIENGGPGSLVAGTDRRLRRSALPQLFPDALVDQHVGVDGHPERERDSGDTRQRQCS